MANFDINTKTKNNKRVKKLIIYTIVIVSFLFFVGTVTFFIFNNLFSKKGKDFNINKTFEYTNELNLIDIDVIVDDIQISFDDRENIYLNYLGHGDSGKLIIYDENNNLILRSKEKEYNYIPILAMQNYSAKIKLILPSKFKKKLNINTASGEININKPELESLNLKSVSGKINILNTKVKNFICKTISGSVKLDLVSFESVKIDSISGDSLVILDRNYKVEFISDTYSGTINNNIDNIIGSNYKINFKSHSGNLDLNYR